MFKLAAALLLALSSGQVEPAAFSPKGVFLFHTNAQQDDRPVCSELWEFTDDGHILIESGQERVRAGYRIETDRDGVWIATCPAPARMADGAPLVSDCYGWLVPADQAG